MPGNNYSTPGQRIGRIKGQVFNHAMHMATLDITGNTHKEPVKSGDTVVFRQVVPFGASAAAPNVFSTTAAAHLIQEGTTPDADTLQTLDTTVTVQKYGALYTYTEKQASLGEDDIPEWQQEQLGERLGLVRELIYIGTLQGCTNRFWSGGTTRATVSDVVTSNLIDRLTRSLRGNHTKFLKQSMRSSGLYGNVAIQPAYINFGHTDLQQDIEKIPGYKAACDYGVMKLVHEMEVGAIGNHRFVLSPDMPKFIDSGASATGSGKKSTTGSLLDVYQMFTIGRDSWGHCDFAGLNAFDMRHISVNTIDKSDPTGERGFVSGTFYDVGVIQNHGFMGLSEVAVTEPS